MKKSKDEKVQKFFEEIMMFNDEQFNILQKFHLSLTLYKIENLSLELDGKKNF